MINIHVGFNNVIISKNELPFPYFLFGEYDTVQKAEKVCEKAFEPEEYTI